VVSVSIGLHGWRSLRPVKYRGKFCEKWSNPLQLFSRL